ncbi:MULTISPECIES: hypothetical protein [Dactylosporangium]|uniref:Uncharacterized protein n=2 Tax=Dactylosporangium TaxID=35753 RepID=A0A9W6KLY8_9ACTN|nr:MULTISPECIES: hypothetical protein [Dactylosporangium]UAB98524.1 hypothetical protein Dvina_10790 [Dactylosporangium vinaceum]UWZ46777.1 hypothetical protein Dmats_10390 [Dactylosporangium matsuzakiense]GLL01749.1 hypothetical protein GCM10017581_034910 [Dactylosporangium matsuzakiense]
MLGLEKKLMKEWEGKSAQEIADAPVTAIAGVSDGDAEKLLAAFNIKTVRDLGTNKYFRWAQGIVNLAD